MDSAIHDLDIICWVMGEKPESVYATGHAHNQMFADCGDVDTCSVVLNFPDGAIGMFDISRNAVYGYDQRIEVQCILYLV